MSYEPDVDDLAQADFTENIVFWSETRGEFDAPVAALRRPMSHSQARALQQWVTFEENDEVFHLRRTQLEDCPDCLPGDALYDNRGRRYAAAVAEVHANETRLLFVGRPTADALCRMHFDFEETSGSTALNRGSGAPTTATLETIDFKTAALPGAVGAALDFNESGARLNCGSDAVIDDMAPLTIALWIKPVDDSGAGTLVDFGQFRVYRQAGKIRVTQACATTAGVWELNAAPAAAEWTHLAISYPRATDADEPAFYVDGELAASTEITAPVGALSSDAASTKYLGNNAAANDHFPGGIDDVRIYEDALSDLIPALAALGDIQP